MVEVDALKECLAAFVLRPAPELMWIGLHQLGEAQYYPSQSICAGFHCGNKDL